MTETPNAIHTRSGNSHRLTADGARLACTPNKPSLPKGDLFVEGELYQMDIWEAARQDFVPAYNEDGTPRMVARRVVCNRCNNSRGHLR